MSLLSVSLSLGSSDSHVLAVQVILQLTTLTLQPPNPQQCKETTDEKSSCDTLCNTADAAKPFRFLDLPLELQLEVFRFCLERKEGRIEGIPWPDPFDGGMFMRHKEANRESIVLSTLFAFPKSLLLVNSHMSAVAKEVFYRENEWLIGCPSTNRYDLSKDAHILKSPMCSYIRHAHFLALNTGLNCTRSNINYEAILKTAKMACVLLA